MKMKSFGFQDSPNPYDEEGEECPDCDLRKDCDNLKNGKCLCECHWTDAERKEQNELSKGGY